MFVRRLILNNFRNYEHLEIDFPDANIFISGNNGVGKTNVLEAIYYLSLGRSFRKAEDLDLIRKGAKEASIYLIFASEADNKEHQLSCLISSEHKIFNYDNEKVRSLSQILGKLLTVYYDPSLVFFFKGEPMERRRFLDSTLSQLSGEYLYSLSRYRKLLKQRNTALQQDYDKEVILVLRNEMINLSYRIVQERKKLIRSLSEKTQGYYNKLFSDNHEFKLVYKTTCPLDDDQESYVKSSIRLFESNQSIENIRKVTLIGPHRDDLLAKLDKEDIAVYGSQGENRIGSLSLKLGTLDHIAEVKKERPILLLDDVTSDLDDQRTENLLRSITKENQQVFVTGTIIRKGFENYTNYISQNNTLTRRNTND